MAQATFEIIDLKMALDAIGVSYNEKHLPTIIETYEMIKEKGGKVTINELKEIAK